MSDEQELNIFKDLENLSTVLSQDASGARAKNLVDYFGEAVTLSQDMLKQPQQPEEHRLTTQLIEGMRAAQRIVRHVWEAEHAKPLNA
jgi:hypothetical protein